MKKTTKIMFFALIGVFILVALYIFLGPKNNPTSSGPITGNEQIWDLGFQNNNFYPNIITLKVNEPIKIVANMNELKGCYRSITIPELGVRKIFIESDNTLIFTPTKTGTFGFSCYMGMGRGKIIIQ